MSSFFGINIATQGLYTAKTSLNVTTHNIANAQTPGYSRQVAEQQALRALPAYGKGMLGTGSGITNVTQIRNLYYDTKYWNVSKYFGEYEVKSMNLAQLEAVFNEPSDSGFNVVLNEFFESAQTLSTNPNEEAYRAAFRDSAVSLTTLFNNMDEQLRNQQRDLNFGVKTKVEEINYIADKISSLNKQIATIELHGTQANDLRDERALLVDDLSKIINVTVKEEEVGNNVNRYFVSINGQVLVDGDATNKLEVRPREHLENPEDEMDLYDIYWSTGRKFNTTDPNLSGELKGYLDLRDGNNGENFTGTIQAVESDNITVSEINRNDLPNAGRVLIGNQYVEYSGYDYDEGNETITFDLVNADSVPGDAVDQSIRIGNAMNYKGVPYYMAQLNKFVRTFSNAVNDLHQQGNDSADIPLFSYNGYESGDLLDYVNMTAGNFNVDQRILDDLANIATAYDTSQGVENNELILELLDLKHDIDMFDKGKPESFMQALISELGIDARQANSFKEGQTNMMLSIENQRLSYSGVDINEETTNLLRFQQAYNLAAKAISVMDEIYNVTINSMGV
ncbi:flagellar hook-associated protein 1 FlgK [Natranaerovirga hydrolytica]|uniref:Flagellar hook-associated protein 1 n=1 Tax=Natranaerovirga hydrolytica TaxID=680378 RepID=A0A4R1MS29_9FIRM|nr:flagellar hook-associated protein FlgK [Natranaerovirga hydrolytica]TCK93379.1 flagellar hook-associated protein 1 FlgK [Natranaerovirga hydrolytica]